MSLSHRNLDRRRWDRLRLRVLEEENWRCRTCGGYGNEVDHIRPLEVGGEPWDRTNVQVLCRSDHIEKTRKENRRRRCSPDQRDWDRLVSNIFTMEDS